MDINEMHYDRTTPLHIACQSGDLRIAKFLISKGAWVSRRKFSVCQILSHEGCWLGIILILRKPRRRGEGVREMLTL